VADFFADQIEGGGELNNEIVIDDLSSKGFEVKKINSHTLSVEELEMCKDYFFIISNFINLSEESKEYLEKNCRYAIYEHDHKYLATRNPAVYKDYLAPPDAIINYEFYKNAKSVFCQTKFHSEIIKKNLKIDNIVNLGGNMWSNDDLEKMKTISLKEKADKYSIIDSRTEHKNTKGAISFCLSNGYEYDLIAPRTYHSFLESLGRNKKMAFFPLTPETLSRVVVEARMMNMKVATNKRVGAISEDWFKLKGTELIDKMRDKRKEIINKVEAVING
jgi:hypothetical protein